MFKISAVLFLILWSFIALAGGENVQSSYVNEVMGACKAEVKDHCHDEKLKKDEVASCLKAKSLDQKNKFTNNCKDTLAKQK